MNDEERNWEVDHKIDREAEAILCSIEGYAAARVYSHLNTDNVTELGNSFVNAAEIKDHLREWIKTTMHEIYTDGKVAGRDLHKIVITAPKNGQAGG